MWVDLQADISIFAFSLFIHRLELISRILYIALAERFIDRFNIHFLEGHIVNILVVKVAFRYCLFKYGWVRGHSS